MSPLPDTNTSVFPVPFVVFPWHAAKNAKRPVAAIIKLFIVNSIGSAIFIPGGMNYYKSISLKVCERRKL